MVRPVALVPVFTCGASNLSGETLYDILMMPQATVCFHKVLKIQRKVQTTMIPCPSASAAAFQAQQFHLLFTVNTTTHLNRTCIVPFQVRAIKLYHTYCIVFQLQLSHDYCDPVLVITLTLSWTELWLKNGSLNRTVDLESCCTPNQSILVLPLVLCVLMLWIKWMESRRFFKLAREFSLVLAYASVFLSLPPLPLTPSVHLGRPCADSSGPSITADESSAALA